MPQVRPKPDNPEVQRRNATARRSSGTHEIFTTGALVLATFHSPKEKFIGAVLSLTAEGISLCGLELGSLTDFTSRTRSGEAAQPAFLFFPMHRLERLELDAADGDIPSVQQQFEERTGKKLSELFAGKRRRA